MPKKVKWEVSAEEIDEVEVEDREEFEPYDGPMPKNGTILLCDLKAIKRTEFNSGNNGLKILAVVNDPGKPKYDGLAYWDNMVDVPQNAWKLNQFLASFGATGAEWGKTLVDEENRVVAFGKIKTAGLQARIVHGTRKYEDEPQAEIRRWLPKSENKSAGSSIKRAKNEEPDDDDDDYGDDEPPF